MSTEEKPKAHAAAWTLAVITAVLVLYVLTIPFVYLASAKEHTPYVNNDPDALLDPFRTGPVWFTHHYCRPYVWLTHTPLETPLTRYWNWCLFRNENPWLPF